MKFSSNDYKIILNEYVSLTGDGFNSLPDLQNYQNIEDVKSFIEQRNLFLSKFNEFETCCTWLSKFKTVKTPQVSSIFLKNSIQILSNEYISNGAVIAAAIHLKISMKRYSTILPHALLGISKNCSYIKKTRNLVDLII